MLTIPIIPFWGRLANSHPPTLRGQREATLCFWIKLTRGLSLYLPKIFSCLSITVLYNSVSLNHDFSSREEKIFTATFSPCQLPLHTSPYRPFPGESNTEVTWDWRTGEVARTSLACNYYPPFHCLRARTESGAINTTTFLPWRHSKVSRNLPLLATHCHNKFNTLGVCTV